MKTRIAVVLSVLLLGITNAAAQVDIRKEQVHFKKGASIATIQGHIKGSQMVDYQLKARAGQSVVVDFKTGNPSSYFNVTAPGADSALFIGSTSGNRFEGELPADGVYTIRVYLMRNAARRSETAQYTLKVTIAGAPKAAAAMPAAAPGPTKYDASGKVKCSAGQPSLDQWCGSRVVRDRARGSAKIWIENIAHKGEARYRVLHYENKVFTTDDKANLSWQRQDDNWWVGADGKEFYLIPDALIHGG